MQAVADASRDIRSDCIHCIRFRVLRRWLPASADSEPRKMCPRGRLLHLCNPRWPAAWRAGTSRDAEEGAACLRASSRLMHGFFAQMVDISRQDWLNS